MFTMEDVSDDGDDTTVKDSQAIEASEGSGSEEVKDKKSIFGIVNNEHEKEIMNMTLSGSAPKACLGRSSRNSDAADVIIPSSFFPGSIGEEDYRKKRKETKKRLEAHSNRTSSASPEREENHGNRTSSASPHK